MAQYETGWDGDLQGGYPRPKMAKGSRMKAECQAWADTEGAPCLAWPWLSLVPREGELVINARLTWGLQHALVDLTVTVFAGVQVCGHL